MGVKKVLLMLLITLISISFTWSNSGTSVFEKYPTSIGGFFGEIGGMGLSYQKWLYPLGFEISGGLTYVPPDSIQAPEEFFTYNLGFQIMYTIIANDITDWLSGNLYSFGGFIHYGYLYISGTSKTPVYASDLGVGAGFGIETVLLKHFSFPLEFGLDTIWTLGNLYPKKAGFFAQGGFRYRF